MTVTVQGAKATGENWRDNWQTPVNVLELVTLFYIGSRPREFGEVFGELGTVLQGGNRA